MVSVIYSSNVQTYVRVRISVYVLTSSTEYIFTARSCSNNSINTHPDSDYLCWFSRNIIGGSLQYLGLAMTIPLKKNENSLALALVASGDLFQQP